MSSGQGFALLALTVWGWLFWKGRSGISRTPVPEPKVAHSAAVTVYMPARDEREVIEASVHSVLAEPAVDHLVVVDDRSRDGTHEWLLQAADGFVSAVRREAAEL